MSVQVWMSVTMVTMGCYDVDECCYGLWGNCNGVLRCG